MLSSVPRGREPKESEDLIHDSTPHSLLALRMITLGSVCLPGACSPRPGAAVPGGGAVQDVAVTVEAPRESGAAGNLASEFEPLWVSVGEGFACATTVGGQVWCWGDYQRHVLEGLPAGMLTKPTPLPGVERALQVAVGPSHACVLRTDGTVQCWGANERGQCGTTPSATVSVPTEVSGLPKVQRVSIGETLTCAIAGEELYCWGDDPWCRFKGEKPQVALEDKGEIRVVRQALDQACALTANGVWCEGAGSHSGWRTDGPGREEWEPSLYDDPTKIAGGEILDLMVGTAHVCVLRAEGAVQCWGNMLSPGPHVRPTYKQSWALDFEIADARSVSFLGGGDHTTCIVAEGHFKCRRGGTAVETPIEGSGAEVRQLSMRDDSACTLLEAGAIWCWGAKMSAAGVAGQVWSKGAPNADKTAPSPPADEPR